ncbi:MAG TPA: MFS transporter [Spirochaetota bacterium]|nr:MFS transporter [Spirochaetota bacterium]HPC40348.1 MFS transporter [Spirochaetota bacterium]HPL16105.1 MFS transporter [Spirochaetota bacterium]HQF07177.1 MFS transporter [Spirochaetota bacterium]HQH96076.1 MFS transporter [Spirochaetota bacterium]
MNDQSGTREYKLSRGYTNYIFILLFLLYFFDYVDRMVVTSLFPHIKEEWGITDAQCGMLVSAIYWSIVLFTIPASVLVDRWSRKKTIGLMAVVWSIATAVCALTKNFGQLFAARCVIGIGEAGYAPGGTAMLAGLYPEEKRSRMMGIWNASIPLGSAVGIALGGIIAKEFGWRHAFGLVALPGLIVAILFFFVKDYKTVDLVKTVKAGDEGKPKVRMNKMDVFREFIHTPSLIFTYFGFAAMTFVTTSLITWLPTFFNRVHNIPMDQAGMKGGSVMLLALVGAPVGGLLADLWLKKRKNARLLFSVIVALLSAIFLATGLVFFNGNAQYIFILLMGLVVVAFVPAAAAVTQDVVHPGLRAISYALCVIVQNILGSSLGPIVVGSLSDNYDIQTALLVLPAFLVVAAVLFFIGSFFYERDLDKVEKVVLEAES